MRRWARLAALVPFQLNGFPLQVKLIDLVIELFLRLIRGKHYILSAYMFTSFPGIVTPSNLTNIHPAFEPGYC